MLTAFVNITESCLLNCKYCFYITGQISRDISEKTVDLDLLVNSLYNLGVNQAIITGGDPFVPKVMNITLDLARKLRHKGIPVSIDTSLLVSNKEHLYQIADCGFSHIYVSCDSHEPLIHNQQRGGWITTINAMNYLINKDAKLSVNCTVTQNNYEQLALIWKYFHEMGVIDIDFNLASIPEETSIYTALSCENLNQGQKDRLIENLIWCAKQKYADETRMFYVLYQINQFLDIEIQPPTSYCKMGREFIVVNQMAEVMPCFHRSEAWGAINETDKIKQRIKECQQVRFDCKRKSCSSLFAINSFWTP